MESRNGTGPAGGPGHSGISVGDGSDVLTRAYSNAHKPQLQGRRESSGAMSGPDCSCSVDHPREFARRADGCKLEKAREEGREGYPGERSSSDKLSRPVTVMDLNPD